MTAARTINSLVIGLGSMAYGKERRAVRTFKRLPKVNPFFLTPKWEDGSVSQLLRDNGLKFSVAPFGYLGRSRLKWTLIALCHAPILYVKVIANYLRKDCDVIVVISVAAFVNALPAILFLRYFCRARLIFYLGDSAKNYGVNRVLARLMNLTAKLVITNSNAVKNSWIDVGVKDSLLRVIYNGVDVDLFDLAEPFDFRKRFGWPADSLVVGYAGQFTMNKGVEDFVASAESLIRQRPHCRFVLIGHSTLNDDLERKIAARIQSEQLEDRIVFAGWTDKIETYIKGLDILVVPSRHEDPAPNVNLEAMASGVPVIATRVGGTPEIVVDGLTGVLVEKESPELIAQSIRMLDDDVVLRRRMGLAARERVRSFFHIEINAHKIQESLADE